jgi:hypothetical protein
MQAKKIPQVYAGFFNQDSINRQPTGNTYVVKDIYCYGRFAFMNPANPVEIIFVDSLLTNNAAKIIFGKCWGCELTKSRPTVWRVGKFTVFLG